MPISLLFYFFLITWITNAYTIYATDFCASLRVSGISSSLLSMQGGYEDTRRRGTTTLTSQPPSSGRGLSAVSSMLKAASLSTGRPETLSQELRPRRPRPRLPQRPQVHQLALAFGRSALTRSTL
jgi:hypothetical protein